MNKKFIVGLASLLKVAENVVVENLSKEDGDDSILKDFSAKHNVYSLDELSTLIKNSNKAHLEKADFDINEVPKALYSKIAAAAFESKEKSIAKEYGIEKYDNLQDLLAKVIESKTGKGVDEQSRQQIETLKATIKTLEQDKEKALNDLKNQHDSDFITRDFDSALSIMPLDCEGEALEKQRKLLRSAFSSEHKLARKDGKTVVLDKDGKPVTNKLGDPEELSNVVKTFAEGYGIKFKAPDPGGRGAGSSDPKPSLKGLSFEKVREDRGIKPNTNESDELYKQWKADNQEAAKV